MSINEQIEAAWKEYKPEALSTNSMVLSHDVFTAGYLAALRSLFVEVKPEELVCGQCYTTAIRINDEIKWFDRVMVSLSDGGRVCRWQNHEWEYFDRRDVLKAVILLPVPSPSDIFGRGE